MAGRVITKNQSMAQVRLDNGERVLISFTKSEAAIFKLIFIAGLQKMLTPLLGRPEDSQTDPR